ncbi:hypothetical protein N7520_002180 [Penicillium odoratum]|uniref:uncharacterized protein n=1 Tax=Penicillium odoratum TaxID=1167516 RepID=UPI002549874F|nr:uncharacterized protein N7520_002180 [Penicillium odoratum]KAJ5771651.1 hypothetical protein N7520_002180 [Penicillium odoratum]
MTVTNSQKPEPIWQPSSHFIGDESLWPSSARVYEEAIQTYRPAAAGNRHHAMWKVYWCGISEA